MDERNYCCLKMQEEEWYFKVEEYTGELALYEDYSVHYLSCAKYCPWCGKELKVKQNG
jgi:hypothetical protein